MASDEPRIPLMRASVIQGNLDALASLGPQISQKVRATMDAGLIESIESASRIAWLPLQHDLLLTAAVDDELGRGALLEWARSSMLVSLRKPLLEPLLRAAVRVFGMSPGALFRAVPLGWKAVYRNVGTAKHESRPSSAILILSQLHEVLVADLRYLQAMCGTFTALLEIASVPGIVEISRVDERRRTVEYTARWGQALDTSARRS